MLTLKQRHERMIEKIGFDLADLAERLGRARRRTALYPHAKEECYALETTIAIMRGTYLWLDPRDRRAASAHARSVIQHRRQVRAQTIAPKPALAA